MKWDEMGFVETWRSKKVDGSIQDYLVTTGPHGPRLFVAVHLRGDGLFTKHPQSVLLIYDL